MFLSLGIIAGIYAAFLLKEIILGLFISLLVAAAFNPYVTRLAKRGVPRAVAALSMYVLLVVFVSLLLGVLLPPLVSQTVSLVNTFPLKGDSAITVDGTLSQWMSLVSVGDIPNLISRFNPILKAVTSTFSSVITFITFAVITFYLLVDWRRLPNLLAIFLPGKNPLRTASQIVDEIEFRIGGWVRGQFLLMLLIGTVTYIGLRLLGIPYALPLAILAGLFEVLPNIGPTLAAVPAILVPIVTEQNFLTALFVMALYILIQQLENNIIVPKIMQSAVGLHPIITMVLLIAGFKVFGVLGAILSVPLFLVIKVVVYALNPDLKKRISGFLSAKVVE